MTTVAAESNTKPAPRRSRAGCRPACRGPDARAARDAGAHPAADGRAYQQAHKYEKDINRVAAGRLYNIAQALGVDVSYFFEGLGSDKAFSATPQQRMLLELARNFISIPERKHRDAVCSLARALSEAHGPGGDPEE